MADTGKFKIRNRPTQQRAQETFDLILRTTAKLLEEVGFDKLNTNLVCKQAKLTPPALYRYFPNKYAILEELGRQLMAAQNQSSLRWMDTYRDKRITREATANLLQEQYEITKSHKGAKWIMRSLRSVPILAQVRLDSHTLMNTKFTDWYVMKFPKEDAKIIERRVRITNELGYALIEMLLDGNYDDEQEMFDDVALMMGVF